MKLVIFGIFLLFSIVAVSSESAKSKSLKKMGIKSRSLRDLGDQLRIPGPGLEPRPITLSPIENPAINPSLNIGRVRRGLKFGRHFGGRHFGFGKFKKGKRSLEEGESGSLLSKLDMVPVPIEIRKVSVEQSPSNDTAPVKKVESNSTQSVVLNSGKESERESKEDEHSFSFLQAVNMPRTHFDFLTQENKTEILQEPKEVALNSTDVGNEEKPREKRSLLKKLHKKLFGF